MSRRLAGEGTVYKRRDGRWEAAIYRTTTAGIRKRFRFCAKTNEEARSWLLTEQQKAKQGRRRADHTSTLR